MSKYKLLWEYIKNNNRDNYELSFDEIKRIVGFDIDHSFLTYKRELSEYGYVVSKISMKDKKIFIDKVG